MAGRLTPEDVDSVVAPPLLGIVDLGAQTLWLTQSHLEGVDDDRVVEGWLNQNYPLITEQYPTGVKLSGYMLQGRFDRLPELAAHAVHPAVELAPGLLLAACEIITPEVSPRTSACTRPAAGCMCGCGGRPPRPLTERLRRHGPDDRTGRRVGRPALPGQRGAAPLAHSDLEPGEFMRDEVDVNLNPVTPPGSIRSWWGCWTRSGNRGATTVECGHMSGCGKTAVARYSSAQLLEVALQVRDAARLG